MRKEQIMILTITIAITVAFMMGWYCFHEGKLPLHHVDSILTEEEKMQEDSSEIRTDDKSENEQVEYAPFETAKYVTVEKVVRTTTEDGEGNSDTVYESYLMSDVDLLKGTDDTREYAGCLAETEYDASKELTVSFLEEFGFSYQGLSGLGVHDTLLEVSGFDGDLSDVSFDAETYEMTGQKLYVLNKSCLVTKQLIPKDAETIIEEKAYYQTMKDNNGVIIPDYYVALVRYTKGDKTVEKSMYLQITINNWGEESDEAC